MVLFLPLRVNLACLLALVLQPTFTESFQPSRTNYAVQPRNNLSQRISPSCIQASSSSCSSGITAEDLRSIKVTNVKGECVPLGDAMGSSESNDTKIVVFLRHLGCTWCWSYLYQWTLVQDLLSEAGVGSPIFVSIGDPDRLSAFLKQNPSVDASTMFVDGYDFAAYQAAGFERFDEKPEEVTANVQPKPARFNGLQGWWTFLTSFIPLAPVTPDMKFPENLTPEGLFWVGGTFVIRGNDIVYRWNDRISGDHPEVEDVVRIAIQAAA